MEKNQFSFLPKNAKKRKKSNAFLFEKPYI